MLTLIEFIKSQPESNMPKQDAVRILEAICDASKIISKNVNRAGLIDIIGTAGEENVQGEEQQKLDVFADNELLKYFKKCGIVGAAASEENEEIVVLNDSEIGKYIVAFDPLDGSSNIDVNVSIGTIFNVFERTSPVGAISANDFLRKGDEQLMAGYVIYGSSTMLILTMGNGVQGFTLDPESNEFGLSHPNIKTTETGRIYSLNEGNAHSFDAGLLEYLEYCKSKENDTGKPYSSRYIGSMVADIHRNLIKGGIFIYPGTASSPSGKLRLLYECQAMAFVAEQARNTAT